METLKLKITNMSCAGCADKISKVLKKAKGVESFNSDVADKTFIIEYDPRRITSDQIIKKIEKIKYQAQII